MSYDTNAPSPPSEKKEKRKNIYTKVPYVLPKPKLNKDKKKCMNEIIICMK